VKKRYAVDSDTDDPEFEQTVDFTFEDSKKKSGFLSKVSTGGQYKSLPFWESELVNNHENVLL